MNIGLSTKTELKKHIRQRTSDGRQQGMVNKGKKARIPFKLKGWGFLLKKVEEKLNKGKEEIHNITDKKVEVRIGGRKRMGREEEGSYSYQLPKLQTL